MTLVVAGNLHQKGPDQRERPYPERVTTELVASLNPRTSYGGRGGGGVFFEAKRGFLFTARYSVGIAVIKNITTDLLWVVQSYQHKK